MVQELNYDVLVVGGGNAALCSALAARERGAKVGILEKASKSERGGNSTLTAHMRFVYNSVEDLAPLIENVTKQELDAIAQQLPKRTEADLWDEIMRATNNQSDHDLLKVHVRESYNTILWLRSKGHSWVSDVENPTAGNNVLMSGGGFEHQARNFTFLENDRVPVHYETAATELIQDDQARIIGVRAMTSQGPATFRTGAVVLACGGFEANPEMRGRYLGPQWDTVKNRGVCYNTGDGLRMALDIGAMSHGSWTSCHASPQDLHRPTSGKPSDRSMGGQEWNRYAYPFGLMVDIQGRRFADEGEDIRALTYAKMGRTIIAQTGGKAFQIFDAKHKRLGILAGYDKFDASGASADTLEDLASKLGTDPSGLVETVRTFNTAIQPGPMDLNPLQKDGKHTLGISPPKSNYAISIEEPPFVGYEVCCGITFTFGGLKVDPETAQVQHVAGRPIPGLYTAGEMLGGLWHWSYASGSGMMAGATFGRMAGTQAAKTALGQ